MRYLALGVMLCFVLGACASGGTSKPTSSPQPEPLAGFVPPGLTEEELATFVEELLPHVENDTGTKKTAALISQKEVETGCNLLPFSHYESPEDLNESSVRVAAREYVESNGIIVTFFRTDRFGWLGLGADC